jgi:hypothetical protein
MRWCLRLLQNPFSLMRGIWRCENPSTRGEAAMFLKTKLTLLLVVPTFLAGCGGGGAPRVTGLKVQTYPSDGIGYASQQAAIVATTDTLIPPGES